jgi:oligoribonuclease (3'-5' exoribonuclease)
LPEFAFAFMDCEFGGLDPELHDITEIAVIVTDYRLVECGAREWKVIGRPDRITPEAAELFNYDPKEWQEHGVQRQALTELAAVLPRGKTVVPAGQNVRMDVLFLERGFRKCEIPYPFDYHVIDLATLYYSWSLVAGETVPALSLRQAALNAGLVDGPVAHRALADSRLTLETYRHYIGRLAPRPLPDVAIPRAPDPDPKKTD